MFQNLEFWKENTVLLLASGHFSHEFGHHASREAAVKWQNWAAACSAQPHILPIKQESTAKVCQMRETGGQKQATARYYLQIWQKFIARMGLILSVDARVPTS